MSTSILGTSTGGLSHIRRCQSTSRTAQVVACGSRSSKQSTSLQQKAGSLVIGLVATISVASVPMPDVLLDATPLSTNDLIEKLNTNILPKIRQQIAELSKSNDNNSATDALKRQLQTVESSIGKLLDDVQTGKDDLIPGDAGELQLDFDNIKKSLPNFS